MIQNYIIDVFIPRKNFSNFSNSTFSHFNSRFMVEFVKNSWLNTWRLHAELETLILIWRLQIHLRLLFQLESLFGLSKICQSKSFEIIRNGIHIQCVWTPGLLKHRKLIVKRRILVICSFIDTYLIFIGILPSKFYFQLPLISWNLLVMKWIFRDIIGK